MTREVRWLLGGLGVATVGAIVFVAARASATSAPALVVLGDSLAVGLTPYLKKWAVARNMRFSADAKVGRPTSAQSIDLVSPGSLVFVSLGTNDAVKQTTGAQIKRLAEKIRAAGAKRIVWLVPPATAPLPGLAAIRAAINAAEVDTATTHVALRKDGLHPSNYAIAAKDVLRTLAT